MSFTEAGIADPPVNVVSVEDLRKRFAAGKYIERAMAGEFTCCLKDVGAEKTSGNLTGFRGYMVGYLNRESVRVFSVHWYLSPTGEIGASGLLDPKWLYEEGEIYVSAYPPA